MITAQEALERLKAGNARYISESATSDVVLDESHRTALVDGQEPFAIILGCSDSRAPAELIFDQGLGELFVIRVAGNIAAPSQIGSVEYAAAQIGTPLVVVLGHTNCGAIAATLQQLRKPEDLRSPNLKAIVHRIEPALSQLDLDSNDIMQQAVEVNVEATISNLNAGSEILQSKIADGLLTIVGAVYDLQSGQVTFLDER